MSDGTAFNGHHVDELWWGSLADLRDLLTTGYLGGFEPRPDGSAILMECPLAPGSEHFVRATEPRADHATLECSAGCDEVALRAGLARTRDVAAESLTEPSASPPVDGAALLDDLAAFIRRFVVVTEAQAAIVALWTVHTHAVEAAETTPYLSITSAELESGKTRLLEVTDALVARPWLTGRVTAAVLARKVDAERPTLLLDESDAAFKGEKEYAEALRGLLNTGYRAGGKASLCVGQGAGITYRDFSTFGAKAIAGIGKLPDTVASRSLPVRLERRAPGEHVEPWRERRGRQEAAPLRQRAEAWASAHADPLREAEPEAPPELRDRAQDTAEPLLAIADLAGGAWAQRARRAIVELHSGEPTEDGSIGVRLLADVRAAFEAADADRVSTADLLQQLHALDEAPWAERRNGRPLTARGLGDLLKHYRIRSRTIRLDDGSTPKGFKREQFEDAWRRYLPADPAFIRHTATTGIRDPKTADLPPPQDGVVADNESAENRHEKRDVADAADVAGAQAALSGWQASPATPQGEGTPPPCAGERWVASNAPTMPLEVVALGGDRVTLQLVGGGKPVDVPLGAFDGQALRRAA